MYICIFIYMYICIYLYIFIYMYAYIKIYVLSVRLCLFRCIFWHCWRLWPQASGYRPHGYHYDNDYAHAYDYAYVYDYD